MNLDLRCDGISYIRYLHKMYMHAAELHSSATICATHTTIQLLLLIMLPYVTALL